MTPVVDRRTLQEQAYAALRERILAGELPPGTRIIEADESARLGVSRGTLREAFRQLEEQGLLVRDPRRIVSVRKLNPKEIVDLYRVRGALEVLAARLICDLPPSKLRRSVSELHAHAELIAQATAAQNAGDEVTADLSFHEKLCILSENTILLTQWRGLAALIRAMITGEHQQLASAWSRASASIPDHHRKVVEALSNGEFSGVSAILLEGFTRSSQALAKDAASSVETTPGPSF